MVVLSVKQRYWLVKKRVRGCDIDWICGRLGINRDTVYYWMDRFNREGWRGLQPKSHRPHTIHKTSQETVDLVLQLRKAHGWDPTRIEGYFRNTEGLKPVAHNTVYRILCHHGLNKPLDEPRKTWGKRRFQRLKPNEMWQADWKLTSEDKWMITFIDDYSRFIPCSRLFENADMKNSLTTLKQAMQEYGRPQQILTDQGVQFYTWQEDAKTKFTKYLERNDILHIIASKKRPTTIGKVERFHRSYMDEAWRYPTHQQYIQHYNFKRPHQALKYLTPAEVYLKS